VKLKVFFTGIIASASLITTGNINQVLAGSCENAPDTGTVFKWTGPETWKIMTTVRQSISSSNERRVEFAFKKLDLKADRELAQWVSVNVKGAADLTENEKEKFVIGADDEVSEDSLEGFNEFTDSYGKSVDELLVGVVNIGRCHTLGEEVRLTKGINSENIIATQSMKNQDFGGRAGSTNTNNLSSPQETYRKDLNKGYSGYGNLENF
tara:strand:- start:23 stop:649 length:627 start_codon:yes stop_codon:yes gene_type:complete